MKPWHRIALFSLFAFAGCAGTTAEVARSEIRGETVTYQAGGKSCTGYLCYDAERKGRRPGVLVVHEWWGHNDYVRERAKMLAGMGYVALAVDMYGDGKQAGHPQDAQKFSSEVFANMDAATARFRGAEDLLKAHPLTDKDRIAAIGYCFGGGVVLAMARAGLDLDAVASFHGSLATQTPARKGAVHARVLVCHGGDDQFVSAEQVAAFQKEMEDAGVDLEFVTYPGAKHGFTNPQADEYAQRFSLPLGYDRAADEASWRELGEFLATTWK